MDAQERMVFAENALARISTMLNTAQARTSTQGGWEGWVKEAFTLDMVDGAFQRAVDQASVAVKELYNTLETHVNNATQARWLAWLDLAGNTEESLTGALRLQDNWSLYNTAKASAGNFAENAMELAKDVRKEALETASNLPLYIGGALLLYMLIVFGASRASA